MHSGHYSHGFLRTAVSAALLLGICSGDEIKSFSKRPKGYLGLSTAPVPAAVRAQITLDAGFGLSVLYVVPGGPVDVAGIRTHDVLVRFNDQKLTSPDGLAAHSASKTPGDGVRITALRKGSALVFPVLLGDSRDGPESINIGITDLPMGDLLSFLLEQNQQKSSLHIELNDDGSIRLQLTKPREYSGSLSELFRREPPNEQSAWYPETLKAKPEYFKTENYRIAISTKNGNTEIIALDKKTGAEIYRGSPEVPSDKTLPQELRAAIHSIRKASK